MCWKLGGERLIGNEVDRIRDAIGAGNRERAQG